MVITTLLALALSTANSTSGLNVSSIPQSVDSLGLQYADDDLLCYGYSIGLSGNDLLNHYTYDLVLNLHYDSNYNEYLQVSTDLNFVDKYLYVSNESWFAYNYNVSAYSVSYLYDSTSSSFVAYWISDNLILGYASDYGFGGDSDVRNFTPVLNHSYLYCSRIYLRLLDDFDADVVSNNESTYDNGYNNGYIDGYNNGSTDGYNNGYNIGHIDGYNEGYNTALTGHSFSFTNLFASISDTPILMIRRMFSFDIFGVSAISILLSLFTALIFIKIIKRMV